MKTIADIADLYFPAFESDSECKVRELREQLARIADDERQSRNKEWNDQEAARLRREICKKGHIPTI